MLAVDIDQFRAINARFGFDSGDRLLADVGSRLETVAALYGTSLNGAVTRLGGDEFCLLIEHIPDREAAQAIAARVSSALAAPFDLGDETVQITASTGVALSQDIRHAPDALIIEAEAAMRRAKARETGRRDLVAEETRQPLRVRVDDARELRGALANGELWLAFQPKVSLVTDRLVGVEALLRWQHPEKGVIPPLDFIPLAEETGLIVPIGVWVLEQACAEAARWQRTHLRIPVIVSVNVSARQFESGLAELFKGAISAAGIDPASLCLEVTESVVMRDPEFAVRTLRELNDLGVRISIDDFGTGYSSLTYLGRFPLDEVKVDKSFVDGLGHDPEATAIVAATTAMAHAMDLSVVAEGVEAEAQLAALRSLGCDEAQGYYFGRPQRASEIDLLLREAALGEVASGGSSTVSEGMRGGGVVVVVDDAPDVRLLARMSLAAAGFVVHEAEHGEQGLALARTLHPDCVILDVNMPGISGLEVCRVLRADPRTSDTTIVMLTADQQASEKVEAFSLEADDYMVKPFAPRDLISRVSSAMRRRHETAGQ